MQVLLLCISCREPEASLARLAVQDGIDDVEHAAAELVLPYPDSKNPETELMKARHVSAFMAVS